MRTPLRDYYSGATGDEGPARRLRRWAADARFGAISVAPCRQCQVVRRADATKVRELVMPSITRRGAIEGWIVCQEGPAPDGGAASSRCGLLGRQASQMTLMRSIANHHAGLPTAYRLICRRSRSAIGRAALFPGLQRVRYWTAQTPSQARRRIIEVDRTI
jgi:hypothetical protein